MNTLREEKGFAALVAILVLLVLTIIGTNLLQTVMTSLVQVRKTETRGEAEYFARMGMDEAIARLSKAVEDMNLLVAAHPDWTMADGGDIQVNYERLLNENFPTNPTDPSDPLSFHTETGPDGEVWLTTPPIPIESGVNGTYQIKINHRPTDPTPWEDDSPYVERFIIRVIGQSTSVVPETRTLESKLYVNTYPGAFHYVLSSPGNITVNGAPYVEGDSYAGSYTLWNRAEYYFNDAAYIGRDAQPTTYPSFVGEIGVPYTTQEDLQNNRFFVKDENGSASHFDPNIKAQRLESGWYRYFTLSPLLNLTLEPNFELERVSDTVQRKRDFSILDITPIILTAPVDEVEVEENESKDSSDYPSSVMVNGGYRLRDDIRIEVPNDLEINGTLSMDKSEDNDSQTAILHADRIYVHGDNAENAASTTLSGEVHVNQYMYINGNAVIQDLHFRGKMYVKGNLTIQGNFDMNGTIYVDGTVDITEEDASANWEPATDTAVVILSSGKFEAYNLNLYSSIDSPRVMNAFLYSEQDMTLYGIGSNIQFVGGLHGQNITLNAVKGNVTDNLNGTLSIQNQTDSTLTPRDSRLRILFNPALYETPPPGLPTSRAFSIKTVSYDLDGFKAEQSTDLPAPPPAP